jgi:hypothetical protein
MRRARARPDAPDWCRCGNNLLRCLTLLFGLVLFVSATILTVSVGRARYYECASACACRSTQARSLVAPVSASHALVFRVV